MDVAIRGDRSSCLTLHIGAGAYVFAVAHGFGRIDGEPVAPVVLARLRAEFERRARGKRLLRARTRAKGISSLFASAFDSVNQYVHSRSASHEDYVTAGCSLTAALVLGDRAYLSHVGSTAAYLERDGYVVALTKDESFSGENVPVLTRAFGADSSIEAVFCTFSLSEGDTLVIAGQRLSCDQIADGVSGEQVLAVRYEAEAGPWEPVAAQAPGGAGRIVTGVVATLLFYTLLCLK